MAMQSVDDATWILTSALIIFTMQTGFGLLESGCVTKKNSVNILMKNAVDVILGGVGYWAFGYGLQYGDKPGTNPFFAIGEFLLDATDTERMGFAFANFIFQLSFATTATTIVSGAMAERANFNAYCLFSLFNTIIYCIPGGWVWGEHGFLKRLGYVDFAGSSAVHLLGGTSAFVAAYMLEPRLRRTKNGREIGPAPAPGSSSNVLMGVFILWWGWVGFNCGSSFGVSGNKWHYAGRAAISTLNGSVGACFAGLIFSYSKNRKLEVDLMVNSILGGLVGVTGGCAFYEPWEALAIGSTVGFASIFTMPFWERFRVDDPVGAVSVHGVGGFFGTIAIGIFIKSDENLDGLAPHSGALKGGRPYLLGVQLLGCVCISSWSAITTFILLWIINKFVPIRMSVVMEVLGADLVEHNIRHAGLDYDAMIMALERAGHVVKYPWCKIGPSHEQQAARFEKPKLSIALLDGEKGDLQEARLSFLCFKEFIQF